MHDDTAVILHELRELRRLVEALRPVADATAQRACAAIVTSYGADEPFFAVDLIDFFYAQPALRRELGQALMRLCKTDCMPSPMQLSLQLRRLVAAPPEGFEVESVDVRGTLRWTVRRVRQLPPPAPQ